jgi:AmmeMemoRadiSam system protein A
VTELNADERRDLLALAHASVEDAVRGTRSVEQLLERISVSAELGKPRGSFVSLKLPPERPGGDHRLRGCIGTMAATHPLYRNVVEMASKAATADPRFTPVTEDELPGLVVEVSALTPLSSVSDPREIEPGLHGVQLVKGDAGAVFLPQVAGERGWGVEQLLEQLALKAGLPRQGWKGATLSVFRAEVFRGP